MNFGLKITADNKLIIIDMDTAEILAEGAGCADWLDAYGGICTCTYIEQVGLFINPPTSCLKGVHKNE